MQKSAAWSATDWSASILLAMSVSFRREEIFAGIIVISCAMVFRAETPLIASRMLALQSVDKNLVHKNKRIVACARMPRRNYAEIASVNALVDV
ncbi:MAG: hypothetical protein M3T96_03670 [Acidobacteriota bacterium]|nr:hypothetical protein [Acidobacteriota bacterium]